MGENGIGNYECRGVMNYIDVDDLSGSHCLFGIHIYSIERERKKERENKYIM